MRVTTYFESEVVSLEEQDIVQALWAVVDCAMAHRATGYVEASTRRCPITQRRAYDLLRKLNISGYADLFEED